MARNKYPERTVEKILQVSFTLFKEKGYEHTTIQDIVNALGMSKGAIYHHFKSKEDIVDAIGNRAFEQSLTSSANTDPTLNGLQKIREMLKAQLSVIEKPEIDTFMIDLWKDPKMLKLGLDQVMGDSTEFLKRYIIEGIEDGSIAQHDPLYSAQIITLLLNYWVGSSVSTSTPEGIEGRILFIKSLLDGIHFPLFDEETLAITIAYMQSLLK